MTDAYREDWDITSEEGSLCFASAIYSRLVGGEQDEATLQWLAKYLRANAALPNHIARCPGVSFIEDGVQEWREGCEDCLRRTSPSSERSNSMTPPPIIAFWCEGHIAP